MVDRFTDFRNFVLRTVPSLFLEVKNECHERMLHMRRTSHYFTTNWTLLDSIQFFENKPLKRYDRQNVWNGRLPAVDTFLASYLNQFYCALLKPVMYSWCLAIEALHRLVQLRKLLSRHIHTCKWIETEFDHITYLLSSYLFQALSVSLTMWSTLSSIYHSRHLLHTISSISFIFSMHLMSCT